MLFKSPANKEKSSPNHSLRPAAPSLLSVDLQVTGDITSGGEVHISGLVNGDIIAKKLTLSEGSAVTGAVVAETAMVAGALTGRLSANTVILAKTARVVADITHVSLTIETGALFEGYSRRVEAISRGEAALPLSLPPARSGVAAPLAAGGPGNGRADHGAIPGEAAASP
jgi:cytoskeletal protein CcmA (bactofilin family)